MNDEEVTLFDSVLATRMELETISERYGQVIARHRDALLGPGRLLPSTCTSVAADLIRFSAADEQIQAVIEMLDSLLAVAEELRVNAYRPSNPSSTGSLPQGNGDASTSTRAPGAAGPRTRSESGQRKTDQMHF